MKSNYKRNWHKTGLNEFVLSVFYHFVEIFLTSNLRLDFQVRMSLSESDKIK